MDKDLATLTLILGTFCAFIDGVHCILMDAMNNSPTVMYYIICFPKLFVFATIINTNSSCVLFTGTELASKYYLL